MTIEIDLDKIERECAEGRFFSSLVVLELVRRLREAEKDAARWRAVRSLEHCNAVWCAIGAGEAGKNLDAAIDDAMGEPK